MMHRLHLDDGTNLGSHRCVVAENRVSTLEPPAGPLPWSLAQVRSKNRWRVGDLHRFREVSDTWPREQLRKFALQVVNERGVDELEKRNEVVIAKLRVIADELEHSPEPWRCAKA